MKKTKCGGCAKYFTSTSEFDAHRIGRFNVQPSDRRCMTADEMLADGWQFDPMPITDEAGKPVRDVWCRTVSREAGKEYWAERKRQVVG